MKQRKKLHQNFNGMNNFQIFVNSYFHKHMLDISEKAGVITNSSPYISLEHKEYIEKKK